MHLTPTALTEQFMPMAHLLANRVQRDDQDHDDLVHTGLLSLYETAEKYASEGREIDILPRLAWTVFRRSMNRYYEGARWDAEVPAEDACSCRRRHSGRSPVPCQHDLPDPFDGEVEFFEQTLVHTFLREVAVMWGERARRGIMELMDPGEAVVEMAMDTLRHAETERAAGRPARVYGSVNCGALKIQHQHVAASIGMSPAAWSRMFGEIREYARDWWREQYELETNGAAA